MNTALSAPENVTPAHAKLLADAKALHASMNTPPTHIRDTLRPLHDHVLLDIPPPERVEKEVVKDGIIIPPSTSNATNAQINPHHQIARVIAVGHKCEVVKAGDRVVVKKTNCSVFKVEGVDDYIVTIRERDVMGIVP